MQDRGAAAESPAPVDMPRGLTVPRWLGGLGIAACYFVTARLGFLLAHEHPNATAVWAPTGIALATLVRLGRGYWPAVFLGALAANASTALPLGAAMIVAAGNSLEALAGATLVNRFTRGLRTFDRPRDVLGFVLMAGVASTAISATVGVAALSLGGSLPGAGRIWLNWWLGDLGGAMVVAPVLLLWSRRSEWPWRPIKVAEGVLLALGLGLIGNLVFGVPLGWGGIEAPLAFLFFTPVAWAAFRLDSRATATVVLAIAAIALWGTVRGHGPFAILGPSESLRVLQLFLALLAATGLGVAAGVAERRRAQGEVGMLNRELEQRVAERSRDLAHSEKLLADAEMMVCLGSWEWDLRSSRVRWSNEFYRILGIRPDGVAPSYERLIERVHPDDRPALTGAIDGAIHANQPFDLRHRILRPDGSIRVLHARGRAVRGAENTPVRVLGTGQDITGLVQREEQARRLAEEGERQARRLTEEASRRAEAELREARARFLADAGAQLTSSLDYRATLSTLARLAVPVISDWCAVHLLETDGSISQIALAHADPDKLHTVEQALRELPLRSDRRSGPPEVIRAGRSELIPHVSEDVLAEAARSPEQLALLRSLEIASRMTVPLIARGRTLGAITFASGPGRSLGAADLALAEELARRAALAVDNAQLYEQAQQAIRIREDFLAIASHELKTPITSLRLQVQIAERVLDGELAAAEAPAQGGAHAALMKASAPVRALARDSHRLVQLVDRLLDTTRIAAGKLELEPEATDLRELVRWTLASVEDEARRQGIDLQLHAPEALSGVWDRLRLEQVVANLLSNAMRYGAGRPIRVDAVARGSDVVVAVEDEGPGIPAESLTTIFDRFQQAGNRATEGLGLGLHIAREIVAAHGGTISVRSEVGRGSRFEVRLPRRVALAPDPAGR